VATITNKTKLPLKVRLPGGKTLHLGAGSTGQVKSKALEHPPLKELIEAGDILVDDDGRSSPGGSGGSNKGVSSSGGHGGGTGLHRSGDR
jgi:hypothetical protein